MSALKRSASDSAVVVSEPKRPRPAVTMWDLPFESRFLYLDELSFFRPKRMTVSLCREDKGGQKHHNSHVLITAADRGTIVLYKVMLFEWVGKVCAFKGCLNVFFVSSSFAFAFLFNFQSGI